jgi:hypothetical protein
MPPSGSALIGRRRSPTVLAPDRIASAKRGRIAQLTAEHEAIADAAGRLRRAITHRTDDPVAALDGLLAVLMPHAGTEEEDLFVELRAEGSLAEAVEKLCAEHDDIHGALGAVDRAAPDWATVLAALGRLHRHIDNEEHGLFPAAVIALLIDAFGPGHPAATLSFPPIPRGRARPRPAQPRPARAVPRRVVKRRCRPAPRG